MKVLALALTLALAPAAFAQLSRYELVKPTTPEQDARPNSPDVPEGYAISGQFERVVVFRFKYQTDLLKGIGDLVAKEGIKNAVILSGIGSVRNYHIHSVSNREFPSKNVFLKDPAEPADIISINGYVIDGRLHPHITLTDGERAFGGHLEPDTHVFTFAIVTLGVFDDSVDLTGVDDKTNR
jgi:predicted DNA-binding protein with PD1-like motif